MIATRRYRKAKVIPPFWAESSSRERVGLEVSVGGWSFTLGGSETTELSPNHKNPHWCRALGMNGSSKPYSPVGPSPGSESHLVATRRKQGDEDMKDLG